VEDPSGKGWVVTDAVALEHRPRAPETRKWNEAETVHDGECQRVHRGIGPVRPVKHPRCYLFKAIDIHSREIA
jgi:hypothetical protein